jgi:hypothetical protein
MYQMKGIKNAGCAMRSVADRRTLHIIPSTKKEQLTVDKATSL